ncbi:MAG: dihydroorotate dehydrogenase-like protein [Propylenella sp.]
MDLTTRYMELSLKNPLIASASPLNADIANIRRLENMGAAAVVLPSLFEEQIEAEAARQKRLTSLVAESFAEAVTYFPEPAEYHFGPQEYLDLVRRAREAVDIPVIASLNGATDEGWISYARSIAEAGATGLELNVYFIPADISQSGREVEQRYVDIVSAVRAIVSIPVAVKLSPYFSSMGHMARELERAGADALVLFNRFYQPDLDLTELRVLTDLKLSTPDEIRLPLLWLAILSGRVNASLAATTGVASADEVVKYLLAGADAVMSTSSLLRNGVGHMATLLAGLETWLEAREFASLDEVRGLLSQRKIADPQALERANYIRILQGYEPRRS